MTEEYAFEEDAGGVLSLPGTEIAYQTWSYGSWSYVYPQIYYAKFIIYAKFRPVDEHEKVKDKSFEEDAGGVLSVPGTVITYQTWSYGSWSNVYEYKGK